MLPHIPQSRHWVCPMNANIHTKSLASYPVNLGTTARSGGHA